ncbi:deoxyribodipyrimidine photo-lyase [Celeribacter baekdonensis]|uniref:cryptochrome/photolyase family protein n=1 Tax=Celeribacter baekdonensis TaxID=875171 RepID=UPI0030DCED8B|tara:strand:- start:192832 stop:194229 length:1398 start_codon:yes stop_codon:yes gene_type:complete
MTSIWWIRRDFRLSDNPALVAAAALGAVVPVFVCDETVDDLGAAPKWRMGLGVAHLIARIEALGGRVILRSGAASEVLLELAKEVGAKGVYWNRLYDKAAIARDTAVKSTLKTAGIEAQSSNGHLCFEPWTVETKTGGYYKVYTPFWKTVRERDVADVLAVPEVTWPQAWPESEALSDWQMGSEMRRGAEVVLAHCHIGEEAALDRLDAFIAQHVETYKAKRDFPSEPVCSGLSENLAYGEISPRRIWHAGWHAVEAGAAGAEHFLKELVWREFAYHLLYHEPDLAHRNHREGWDGFEWRGENDDAEAWRRGRTGVQFVDAAMREMYVTGVMHNRARMIVASFLTKHLLTDWRIGRAWFEDCLIDWDPAANAMGWQWVAGCGPDAAPYFRVFNPDGQAEKFDADGAYLRAWIAEGEARPSETSLSYFAAVPKSWGLSHQDRYPEPIIGLKEGRERALAAYARLKT